MRRGLTRLLAGFSVAVALSAPAVGFADVSFETLDAVYQGFIEEGSDFDDYKQSVEEYYDDASVTTDLTEKGFKITVAGSGEYIEPGSWEFVVDGDYLTIHVAEDDISGIVFFDYLFEPVAEVLGMDGDLYPSYIHCIQATHAESPYCTTKQLEDGSSILALYIAAPFEMAGIDDIYVTEQVAQEFLFAAEGDDNFYSIPIGKIRFIAHGTADAMTVSIGEYGGNTKRSYDSLVNALKVIKPAGYESFLKAFKEFKGIEGKGFSASAGIDEEAKTYLGISDEDEHYSFYTIRFDKQMRTSAKPRAVRPHKEEQGA
jgi:hypothetical protein